MFCLYLNKYMLYIICNFSSSLEDWHTSGRFDLFLYLPMNRMFVTTGTEFSQFQPIRRIASILLSNISRNALWCFINTVSDTTSTFQNNRYSDIFTLGHEPPLTFFIYSTLLFLIRNEEEAGKEKNRSY